MATKKTRLKKTRDLGPEFVDNKTGEAFGMGADSFIRVFRGMKHRTRIVVDGNPEEQVKIDFTISTQNVLGIGECVTLTVHNCSMPGQLMVLPWVTNVATIAALPPIKKEQ